MKAYIFQIQIIFLCTILCSCTNTYQLNSELEECPTTPENSPYKEVVQLDQPFESVCRISLRKKYLGLFIPGLGMKNSSAILIENDIILTAAHNVFSTFYNKVGPAEITCGQIYETENRLWPNSLPFNPKDVSPQPEYNFGFGRSKPDRDYAIVRIKDPIPYETSFKLWHENLTRLKKGDTIYVSGHPSQNKYCKNRMYVATGKVRNADYTEGILKYYIETAGGNSGGPVWVTDENGKFILVGVHVAGGKVKNEEKGFGIARLINDDFLKQIQDWQ